MVSYTTNYNLALYDPVSDASELFLDYRTDMAGTSASNMTKIETALTGLQDSVDALSTTQGAIFVDAAYSSGSLYVATVSEITSYSTNLKIILRLDQDSNGTVTININGLGVKSVYTINNSGTGVNLTGNRLKKNREYALRYTSGGVFVIVSDLENPSIWTRNTESLSSDKVLTDYSEQIQFLNPNGASRVVTLPAEGSYNPLFIIKNTGSGGYILTIQDDSPATIVTIRNGETKIFASDGSSWTYDYSGWITELVEDTTPQLGGQLDVNGNAIGDGTLELLTFTETGSAVNNLNVKNNTTGNAPELSAVGDDTNIDLDLSAKGTGEINIKSNLYGNDKTLFGFEGEINAQTGTTYTLLATDNGKIVTLNNASAITLTVPNSLPAGWNCLIIQKGAGQVTLSATASGNIRNRNGHTSIAGQYGLATIFIESNAGTAPEIYFTGDTA